MTPRRVKDILWALALFGLVAAILRMTLGLGVTTDLSDGVPWGLWKVLNMIAGVALATGGFVLAFCVHVLRIRSLGPLLRPALLVAFLGYASSCAALLMDIGLPHRFWHPIFFWNEHSFLFEVFWCVLLYFTVTMIEVSPIALEETKYVRIRKLIRRISTPAVILGITFSTMHHTTLGSLFLVSPGRLHEIWYTPWLPVQFILSAIGAGMLAVVLLTLLVSRLYRREAPMAALSKASGGAAIVLSVYFVFRVVDLVSRGTLGAVFSGDWEGNLFLVEMATAILIPVGLLAAPRIRRSPAGLTAAGLVAVAGLVLNRLDVGIFAYLRSSGSGYVPTLAEIALSIGIPAGAGLVFLTFVERFRVLSTAERVDDPAGCRGCADFDPQTRVWRGAFLGSVERMSLIFLIAVPLAMALFLPGATAGEGERSPVHAPMGADAGRKVLRIDGDRDGEFVLFPHAAHRDRLGGDESCATCHHLDRPGDKFASCHVCHSDMMRTTSIFDHEHHVEKVAAKAGFTGSLAGNHSCRECHEEGAPRTGETAKACLDCHAEDMRMSARPGRPADRAISYTRALHESCVSCHEKRADEVGKPILGECRTCHDQDCDREKPAPRKECTTCHG